jgi:rfaE bifunctional protein nucleotidyltransferase chain/domain
MKDTGMNKAIFLDRDGTLNIDLGTYAYKIEDGKLYPGVVEGIAMLSKLDYRILVISNQAGIGKEVFSVKEAERFNQHIKRIIEDGSGRIDKSYMCPHTPEDNCNCRKPKIGMFLEAKKDFGLDLNRCFYVGDKTSDIEAGRRAGCKTILVKTGHKGEDGEFDAAPAFVAENFLDAAAWIFNNSEISKIKTREELKEIADNLRKRGKKIVTCNGSFDVVHVGHLRFLKEAKAQGDILIVGLNSDSSINRYKNKDRPIISEGFRAEMLAGFECVDYITLFEETDPRELLKEIKPDVHANGSEYGENCIEAPVLKEFGARLHMIKRYVELSTTALIEKIKKV